MRTLIWLLLFAVAWPAAAEMTVADATDLAWRQNPEARAIEARYAEASAAQDLANGIVPDAGSISIGARDDRVGRDTGNREVEAEVAVPVWLPGQRPARQALAEAELTAVDAQKHMLRLRLGGEVRETWGALRLARINADLAQRRAETARALEQNVEQRFAAGDVARVDFNLARNERLAAEAAVSDADVVVRAAAQAWQMLTGEAPPIAIEEEAVDTARDIAETHPTLRAATAVATVARRRLQVSEETRRDPPEIALGVTRERDEFGAPENTFLAVKFKLPFSSGPRSRQANASAQAALAQADAELALAHTRSQLDLARARADFNAADRQLEFSKTRLALTSENLQVTQKAFDLGEVDLAALLRARASAFEAELSLNQQRHARALAAARLLQAQGVTP